MERKMNYLHFIITTRLNTESLTPICYRPSMLPVLPVWPALLIFPPPRFIQRQKQQNFYLILSSFPLILRLSSQSQSTAEKYSVVPIILMDVDQFKTIVTLLQ